MRNQNETLELTQMLLLHLLLLLLLLPPSRWCNQRGRSSSTSSTAAMISSSGSNVCANFILIDSSLFFVSLFFFVLMSFSTRGPISDFLVHFHVDTDGALSWDVYWGGLMLFKSANSASLRANCPLATERSSRMCSTCFVPDKGIMPKPWIAYFHFPCWINDWSTSEWIS